jgi:hypothetical protein
MRRSRALLIVAIVTIAAVSAAAAVAAVGGTPNRTYQGTSAAREYRVQVLTACSSLPKPCHAANEAAIHLSFHNAANCAKTPGLELGSTPITNGRFTISSKFLEVHGAAFTVTGTFVSTMKIVGTVESTDLHCGGVATYSALLQPASVTLGASP